MRYKRAGKVVGSVLRYEEEGRNHRRSPAGAETAARAPAQLVPARQRLMVQKIKIERVAHLRKVGLCAVSPVIVDLQLEIGAVFQNVAPSGKQVASRKLAILLHNSRWNRESGRDRTDFAEGSFV